MAMRSFLGEVPFDHMQVNIEACTAGPLSDELAAFIDEVWNAAKVTAPPAWV